MRTAAARLLVVLLVTAFAASAQRRSITEKDLFNFTWVADPQVAPDGSRVAFVRVSVNEKRGGYDPSLWFVSPAGGDGPHRLTTGSRDSGPRFSPDGKYLAFVRVTERDGRPDQPQLFLLSLAGGDSFQITSLPRGAAQPEWSPDGTQIAFLSTTNPEDLARQARQQRAGTQGPATQPSGKNARPAAPSTSRAANTRRGCRAPSVNIGSLRRGQPRLVARRLAPLLRQHAH